MSVAFVFSNTNNWLTSLIWCAKIQWNWCWKLDWLSLNSQAWPSRGNSYRAASLPSIPSHTNCHSQGLSPGMRKTWQKPAYLPNLGTVDKYRALGADWRQICQLNTKKWCQVKNVLLYLSTPQVGNEPTCSANLWQVSKLKASLPIENQLGWKYLLKD